MTTTQTPESTQGPEIAAAAPATVTLTGFLGRDREILETRPKTITRRVWNPIAEMHEPEEEIELPCREYARLSLATHEWQGSQQITRWHRLVAWNLDQTRDLYAVRLARKGDQVRVTGTVEEVELPGENGETIRFTQIVIQDFEYLKKKARQWD